MAETTTLLLDSDIIAYKFASAHQKNFDWEGDGDTVSSVSPLEEVLPEVDAYISDLIEKLKADAVIVCLSCPTPDNWRLNVLPSYKGNRDYSRRPQLLAPIKEAMSKSYPCYERPHLEADDIMGILSTHPTLVPGKKIIVSEDKDMKTIPGWLFNPAKDKKPWLVKDYVADYWHLYQTLVGDSTDNYKGCPGIGPKKAEKLLRDGDDFVIYTVEEMWQRVVGSFEAKGLTEEDALVQSRVARICRAEDYDFKKKEVILWTPTSPRKP